MGMKLALEQAERALKKGEVPVGAVILQDGNVIGRGYNLVETLQEPSAHAEMLAIASASNYLASWRLEYTVLYTTLEPCPMCAGAIMLSRIRKVIYGTKDPRFGSCGTVLNIMDALATNKIQIIGGILGKESQFLLKTFFRRIRTEY
jgi:tRNA(adenine34) deaminase